MIGTPKPGSQYWEILAFLVRNPGSTVEEIAGARRAAFVPEGTDYLSNLRALRARVLEKIGRAHV